ncbi:MAG: site-specific DNA-methyltransferase [Desulfobacteria bacterium]
MAQIQFKGKSFVQNHHLLVKYHELIPKKDKSLTDKVSLHDNLIIHGDNLKALKALLPLYAGKIKCIYIDPPYNTGNEKWAYNDNVNSPMMQEWLGKVVDREDLTRHDKWLCMMMPRLKLLRELLREDGVIFISIDDNEVHHLRMLMDDVFGEENFVADVIWQKKFSPQSDSKYFSDMHDFIVVYAKHKTIGSETNGWLRNLLPRTEGMEERYSNPDNDPRGDWTSSDLTAKRVTPKDIYPIVTPSGKVINPTKGRSWGVSKERFEKLKSDNRIWFGETGNNVPRLKRFRSEVQEGFVPVTIWFYTEVGHNQQAKQELKKIFPDSDLPFETPKPINLLKRIIQVSADKNSIILDSFSGSGTTAHAVLALNKEDGGNRKFILVECEDYADKITAERVRRVIKGVPKAKDENLQKGLGGTFSYFELGKAIELESILSGDGLPTYEELARYIFYTATGEEFDPKAMNERKNFVGESRNYEVYLFYEPDIEKLKNIALTLERAKSLRKHGEKRRLVFAPTKYLDQAHLDELRIDFAQLPFEIYELAR